jgi:hypothetical protein
LTFRQLQPSLVQMSDAMSDYRIEKVRRAVEVTLTNGQRLDGDVFVRTSTRFGGGPAEPIDLLNDDEPFLPLVLTTGAAYLVHKAHIAVVGTRLPEGDDAVDRAVVGMKVEITLADGSSHLGSIFPELRADRQRLIDALNALSLPFVALFTAEQLRLVNRRHIAYARQVN